MPRRNRRPGWGHEPGGRWRLLPGGAWKAEKASLSLPPAPTFDGAADAAQVARVGNLIQGSPR